MFAGKWWWWGGGGGLAKKHHPVKHNEWKPHTVGCFTTRGTGTLPKIDEEGKLC